MNSRANVNATTINSYDFVATQVGLMASKSVAERTAQELNLANNPNIVAVRTRTHRNGSGRPTAVKFKAGLNVITPEEGQV